MRRRISGPWARRTQGPRRSPGPRRWRAARQDLEGGREAEAVGGHRGRGPGLPAGTPGPAPPWAWGKDRPQQEGKQGPSPKSGRTRSLARGQQGSAGQTHIQWRERTALEGLSDGQARRSAGEDSGHAPPFGKVRPQGPERLRGPGATTRFCFMCKLYLDRAIFFFFVPIVFMKKIKKKDCRSRTNVDLKTPVHPRSPWEDLAVERGAQAQGGRHCGGSIDIQGTHS